MLAQISALALFVAVAATCCAPYATAQQRMQFFPDPWVLPEDLRTSLRDYTGAPNAPAREGESVRVAYIDIDQDGVDELLVYFDDAKGCPEKKYCFVRVLKKLDGEWRLLARHGFGRAR